ncbi:MAG TPA: metallophosphoesterase [Allosphingosinicella sp.]
MTRLFHVSDLHFGREDRNAVQWFADTVREEMPDAVICTGDLTMRARSREFAAAADYLEDMPVPVTVEPGNHDLPYFNPIDRFFRPYSRFGRVERLIERPLDLRRVTIIPLKTTARFQWRHNWSWGVVDRGSLKQALALIRAAPADHLKIVACHHPLVDKEGLESQGRTLRGREALQLLAEAGAHATLSGHVHDPFDLEHLIGGRNIRTVGAGTLSERVRATPPSFNELRITADLTLQVEHRMLGVPRQEPVHPGPQARTAGPA